MIIPRGRRKHVRTHLVRPHRTPQTHSNPRSSVAAPVPARPAASSVASRRPQQRVSDNHQRMTAVDQRQMRVDVLEEGEPPVSSIAKNFVEIIGRAGLIQFLIHCC